ncbi:MAG: adenylate/guanylate cyclase domain-containing protein [Desulfatirhabdiaceae bacterium]|nr:adenylate/guanylate cyclase domain-containing protein [Desulfatirhabdiaceae bacterium]
MIERDNRTFICSVVYYDIADYSTKSVEVQLGLKEQLNRFTTEAIKNVAANDRIIIDTGDGTVICFLGDPEDALFVAMSLRAAVSSAAEQFAGEPMLVRFGINLGPVKLVNDINNQKNIIGDGINVGQRVMSFAEPGQILVSRSYYEVVSCLTQEYSKLFHYMGMRADKHIRKHEIYSIVRASEPEKAESLPEPPKQDDAQIPARNENSFVETPVTHPDSPPAPEQNAENDFLDASSASFNHPQWWRTKRFIYGGVAAAVVLVAILSFVIRWNFGDGEIQPVKIALSPETQSKSSDISPPETMQTAENIPPEQAVSAMTTPPDSNMDIQQESPVETPPESAQSKETAGSEQSLQPQPAPLAPNAIIQFAVTPWGEVYVDGKHKGASPPLTSVSLSPGKHRIEIKNTSLPPYSQTHDIKPNEKLKISHKF